MKQLLIIIFSLVGIVLYSQENPADSNPKDWDKEAFYKPGEKKLQKDFDRALSYSVDQNYSINGPMTFAIYINDTGLAKIVDVKPKVKNHQLLLNDLNYVLKKSHKNWEPAQKNNKPINSIFYYKITFNTEVYDHD
ncbi:MAG: hypothetical protein LC112_05670 [Flavobacteriales bacterium]|nr:hypothetical protein [Flavobacteriales bacterium]